jgi:hypothetical protein
MSEIDIAELLRPLETNIQQINDTLTADIAKISKQLDGIKEVFVRELKLQNERINDLKTDIDGIQDVLKNQNITIGNLQTKVWRLETELYFNNHITCMHARKMDDQEQFSRKINLKLKGIEVGARDSPDIILKRIKDEVNRLGLNIPENEFDRCHRVGRKYNFQGKTFQNVLLKLCFWRTRDLLYQNRKKFKFQISPDLTTRRQDVLQCAKNHIDSDDDTYVDFIYVDVNCNLKVKGKDNKFYGFNSENEFLCIIDRLRFEYFATDEHKTDAVYDHGEKIIKVANDYYY